MSAFAGVLGLTGVINGAFGAHYLRDRMTEDRHKAWQTAVQYQLLHAVIMYAAALNRRNVSAASVKHLDRAILLWGIGTTVFSGSIYALCLGGSKLFGPITPLGGVAMIAGWGFAIAAAL